MSVDNAQVTPTQPGVDAAAGGLLDQRPELLIGFAFLGGIVAAAVLKRLV